MKKIETNKKMKFEKPVTFIIVDKETKNVIEYEDVVKINFRKNILYLHKAYRTIKIDWLLNNCEFFVQE